MNEYIANEAGEKDPNKEDQREMGKTEGNLSLCPQEEKLTGLWLPPQLCLPV